MIKKKWSLTFKIAEIFDFLECFPKVIVLRFKHSNQGPREFIWWLYS